VAEIRVQPCPCYCSLSLSNVFNYVLTRLQFMNRKVRQYRVVKIGYQVTERKSVGHLIIYVANTFCFVSSRYSFCSVHM